MVVVEPVATSLELTTYAPLVRVVTRARPVKTSLIITTYAPEVSTTTPKAIVTAGLWSEQVFLQPGDEWIVLLEGPSASDVTARVQCNFEDLDA